MVINYISWPFIQYSFDYLRLFLFLFFIGLLLLILLLLTFFLSYKSSYKDVDKLASYECGFEPFEDTRATFDVQFYLIAIIFIVFDVEIAFLYPWVISLRETNSFDIFLPGFLFFLFVIIGFIFEWYQGALDWKMSNLSKIQLFSVFPFVFVLPENKFMDYLLSLLSSETFVHIITVISIVIISVFSFLFLLTLESTIVMYTIFTLNLFIEKQWTLFFVFFILLFILINFWLSLDHFEYNIDSKIIFIYNIYALCTIFLLTSVNLFEIFLAMEGISLSLIVLIAYKTQYFSALEAAIKYFVQSSIIGCFFSFSVGIIYITTGSFFLPELFMYITESHGEMIYEMWVYFQHEHRTHLLISWVTDLHRSFTWPVVDLCYNPIFIYALITISFCFFFKLSLFPNHFWTPDVYSGSPLIITTIFATVNKLIFFFTFITFAKFSIFAFFGSALWKFLFSSLFQLSAIISIAIGCLGAFRQTSIKRFFGYTTINTLGFILAPLSVAGLDGYPISLSYLLIYSFISLLFFTTISKLYNYKNNLFLRIHYISDLSGLYKINKLAAFSLVFILLVFSGLPPYITFYNKYIILQTLSNFSFNSYFIGIILLTTIITTFYYIRFIKSIFFEQPYLQAVLFNLEKNNFSLKPTLTNWIKNLTTTSKFLNESIIIIVFIIYAPDIFEFIPFFI